MPPNSPDHSLRYQTFVLRVWQEAETASGWRCSLEDPHTGERIGFQNIDLMSAYLHDWTRIPVETKPMTD
jgi:hypothetical protein